MRTYEEFVSKANRNPLLQVRGVSHLNCIPDLLHVKHLGVDTYYLASVMKLMTHHGVMTGSVDENFDRLWKELKVHCKGINTFNGMTKKMYVGKADNFPRLKGRAAEVRNFAQPLLTVFESHMDPNNREHRLVALGLRSSIEAENILDEHKTAYRLPDEAHIRFRDAVLNVLACQTALGNYFHTRNILLFHTTIKSHFFAHVALMSSYCNPRHGWNYSGEDFMQLCKRIVAASSKGTPPHVACSKTVLKYLQGMSLHLLGDDCWK